MFIIAENLKRGEKANKLQLIFAKKRFFLSLHQNPGWRFYFPEKFMDNFSRRLYSFLLLALKASSDSLLEPQFWISTLVFQLNIEIEYDI